MKYYCDNYRHMEEKDIKGNKSTLVKEGKWVVLMPNSEYENSYLEMLEHIKQEIIKISGIPKKYFGRKEEE